MGPFMTDTAKNVIRDGREPGVYPIQPHRGAFS